jgi:hypothetical protein
MNAQTNAKFDKLPHAQPDLLYGSSRLQLPHLRLFPLSSVSAAGSSLSKLPLRTRNHPGPPLRLRWQLGVIMLMRRRQLTYDLQNP